MSPVFGRFGVLLGMVLLFHTGYSVSQLLAFLRYNEEEFTTLPLDIMLEGFFGVALAIWGATGIKPFKEIRAIEDLACKSYESLHHRPSFVTFNHRGKNLYNNE